MEKKKKLFILLGALLAILVVALFVVSQVDVATDLIGRKVTEAVEESTGLDLKIGSVGGNPLASYTFEDLLLLDGAGTQLLSVEKLGASVSLSSLLSGAPALKELSVEGISGDVAALMAALPPSEGPSFLEVFLDEIHDEGTYPFPLAYLTARRVDLATPGGALSLASAKVAFEAEKIDADLNLTFRGLPVKGEVAFDFSDKNVEADIDLSVGRGRVEIEGDLEPALDVTGQLKGFDLTDLALLWPQLAQSGFAGIFSTSLKAQGDWRAPRMEGDLLFEGGRLSGIPFDVAQTSWSYDEKSLSLPDVKARLAAIPLTGKMAFGFGQLPPDLDISLSAQNVAVSELSKTFPALKGAEGTIEAVTVNVGGRADDPRGKVFLRAPSLSYEGQTVKALAFDASTGAKGRIALSGGASWMDIPVKAEGDVVYSPEIRFDIRAQAPAIDLARLATLNEGLKELKPQGNASVTVRLSGKPEDYSLTGTAQSDRARLKGELFEGTKAEFAYAPSGLDLKSFQSRWGQAALSASGKVTGLAEAKPQLALSGKVANLDVASLIPFAPALADMSPSGKISLDWKASGSATAPTLSVTAASARLNAEPGLGLEGVEASGSFTPGGEALLASPLKVAAKKVNASGALVEDLSALVQMEGSLVRLSSLSARLGGGSLTASGTIDGGKSPQVLDVKGEIKGVDPSQVLTEEHLPMDVAGKIDGSLAVTGTTESPALSFKASSPALTVADLAMTGVNVEGEGSPSALSISRAEAVLGGAPFSAKADLTRTDEGYSGTFSAEASAIDVAQLAAKLPEASDLALAGKVDFSLSGSADGKSFAGQGKLSSPSLSVRGLNVTNLDVPLLLDGESLRVEGARATIAGGETRASAKLLLERKTWTAEASVKGADLKAVTQALAEGKGSLSGPADLSFKGNGNVTFGTILGRGTLSVGEGELEGFQSAELLAKLHGSSSIRYRSLLVNYNLDSSGLQLLLGTRALATPGDNLYRTLETDGSIGFDKKLALAVKGNVNVQALNALLGGVEGLLTSGGQTPEALLKGLFQGVTGGGSQKDFRDVTFNLHGTTEAPKMSNLKIEQPLEQQGGEPPAQGKDVQAAPDKIETTDPGQILQKEIFKQIFGD